MVMIYSMLSSQNVKFHSMYYALAYLGISTCVAWIGTVIAALKYTAACRHCMEWLK